MKILVSYRGIPGREGWETGASLVRAFKALGHDARPWAKTYQQDRWWLPPWRVDEADLLVYTEMNDADPEYSDLPSRAKRSVYWEFDTSTHVDKTKRWLSEQRFDRVFMANKRLCKELGGIYLPYAYDLSLAARSKLCMEKELSAMGAAIVGTAFPQRKQFAEAIGVKIVEGKFGAEYLAAIHSLVVHVHHYDSGGDGLIVMRPWETMGLGTCLLTQRTPELEELFDDGVHCVMYDSIGDAQQKLTALLAKPKDAFEVGRRGRELVEKKHLYVNRAIAILASVGL